MANPVDLEPQAKAVVDANAAPPFLFELGPDQGRRTIDELQSGPVKKPTVDLDDTTVPGGPSGQVSVRILRPQGARRPLAVILYLHGAGWVFGNHHTHDRLIRELAVGAQAAVVFPNYSRSPEAKYPTAIQECYAVASWVAEHGLERGLDPSRIAIAGDSVGGNMTAAVTLLANQRGGPVFRHQVLFYPVTDASFDTGSYRQFATGYYLRRDAMQWSWDQYTTDPAQRADPPPPRCAPASSSSPACRPPWSSPARLTWSATRARPMPTGSATLASLSPPTASTPSSTTSSCSTPSRTPTPPGAPSPWPPTRCERCCPTRPEAPACRAFRPSGKVGRGSRRPSPNQARRR